MAPLGTATVPARVLVVDDQDDVRMLMRVLLHRSDDSFEVVGDAADGPSAIAAVRDLHPDVVILDHMMPGMTGVEAAGAMLSEHPDLDIILCSAYLTTELRQLALDVGIRATLDKMEMTALPDHLREVLAGS